VDMAIYLLPIKSNPKIINIDIRVKDTIWIAKNTNERPCIEEEPTESFTNCMKSKAIEKLLQDNILNCSEWVTDVLLNFSLPDCKSFQNLEHVSNNIANVFIDILLNQRSSGCYFHCQQTIYSASLNFGIPLTLFYIKLKNL